MSISFSSTCRKKTNIQKQINYKAVYVKAEKAAYKKGLFEFLPVALTNMKSIFPGEEILVHSDVSRTLRSHLLSLLYKPRS